MSNEGWFVASRNLAIATLLATTAAAQIPQDHPELCGNAPGQAIPLPEGTTFSASDSASNFTFKLKNGAIKTIDLGAPEAVEEVCPISGDRLLAFGSVAHGDGPFVFIIDRVNGTESRIAARNPLVSPDQRWLIYRLYYPRSAEITLRRIYLI